MAETNRVKVLGHQINLQRVFLDKLDRFFFNFFPNFSYRQAHIWPLKGITIALSQSKHPVWQKIGLSQEPLLGDQKGNTTKRMTFMIVCGRKQPWALVWRWCVSSEFVQMWTVSARLLLQFVLVQQGSAATIHSSFKLWQSQAFKLDYSYKEKAICVYVYCSSWIIPIKERSYTQPSCLNTYWVSGQPLHLFGQRRGPDAFKTTEGWRRRGQRHDVGCSCVTHNHFIRVFNNAAHREDRCFIEDTWIWPYVWHH